MATISNNNSVKHEHPKSERGYENLNDTSTWKFPLTEEQLNILHGRMIDEKTYNILDDDTQLLFVRYNPTNNNILQLLKFAQSLGVMARLLAPLFEILNSIPNPNPLEQMVRIMQLVNKFFDFVASIRSLKDVPIIGTLAAPVIDLFLVVWDIIVSIFLLIFSLFDGKLIALLRSEEFWKSISTELSNLFSNNNTNWDSLIANFQDKNFWEQMEMIIGKKEVTKIKQEIIKIIKPMCDLLDEFKTLNEAMQQMMDMINQIHPLGDSSWGASLCKFLFGRTPKEMFQGSKELNKMMKGPLALMDEMAESMEKITKSYYMTKEDYALITQNNKAKSKSNAKTEQAEKIKEQEKSTTTSTTSSTNQKKESNKKKEEKLKDTLVEEMTNGLKQVERLTIDTEMLLPKANILDTTNLNSTLQMFKMTPDINKEVMDATANISKILNKA